MAININGSGTITGVSVGGLPDGIVDTDMLATDAVSAAKLQSTAIASGDLPVGTILQVVRGSTGTSTAMTSSAFADTSLTVDITPKAANSDFFIIVDQRTSITVAGGGFGLRIMRNTTALHVPTQDGNGVFDWYFNADRHLRATLTFFDTGATYTLGDTLTYKSQGHPYNSSGITFQPTSSVEGSTSYITVMEVAGS